MADINNQQKIGRIITRLTVAIQNAGMYPDSHPQVLSQAQEAFVLLVRPHEETLAALACAPRSRGHNAHNAAPFNSSSVSSVTPSARPSNCGRRRRRRANGRWCSIGRSRGR